MEAEPWHTKPLDPNDRHLPRQGSHARHHAVGQLPRGDDAIHAIHDEIAVEPTNAMPRRSRRARPPRRGHRPGSGLELETPVRMSFNLSGIPSAARLDAGATPQAMAQRILYVHHFGVEFADEGGAIDTGASTTSLPLGTGQGANFTRGTWVKVLVSGSGSAMVTAISTDTLTVAPALRCSCRRRRRAADVATTRAGRRTATPSPCSVPTRARRSRR